MKTIILYKTKNGSTKDYAEFIHSKISGSLLMQIDSFDAARLEDFDTVILGSATYAGKIIALDFLIGSWQYMKNKNVILFTVGMMDPMSEASKQSYETIPEHIREKIHYLKVPGRLTSDRLNFLEKLMVKAVKVPIVDKVDFHKIEPILGYI